MIERELDAPHTADEYHFHRCPVEGCGASISCAGETQAQCDARIEQAVAEEDAMPDGRRAPAHDGRRAA